MQQGEVKPLKNILSKWSIVSFVAIGVIHSAHDYVWFIVGRHTELSMEWGWVAILVVTALITVVSRWLGHKH